MHHTTVCALCEKLRGGLGETKSVCERKRQGWRSVREREELGCRFTCPLLLAHRHTLQELMGLCFAE